jgi:hypothetical protein
MRKLPEKFKQVKAKVKIQLNDAAYVCLTTDIWTSRTTEGYITVTCHFIGESWQMVSFVLETFNLCVNHTAENIAAELVRIADEWNITEKVVAIVTDNAANMVVAIRITRWKHIPCFAHTLNLIVQGALSAAKETADLKKKCKDMVTFFHQSTKASDKLKEVQRQLGVPEAKLIQDVETRWNSTFYMFQRILEQQEAITTTLCLQGRNEMCLSASDKEHLKKAMDVLQPFETATTEMSAEKYVSVSKIIPLARSLQRITVGSVVSQGIKNELVSQMRNRFVNMEGNVLLTKSTLLDPRFKKMGFLTTGTPHASIESLTQEMESLQAPPAPAVTTESNLLWQVFDDKVADRVNARQGMNDCVFESRQYFEEHVISRADDPLEWWSKNSQHYPTLAKLARKYLCITATSVPSERLFSKAGELISHKRSRMKPKNVNMFLFLNKNIE